MKRHFMDLELDASQISVVEYILLVRSAEGHHASGEVYETSI